MSETPESDGTNRRVVEVVWRIGWSTVGAIFVVALVGAVARHTSEIGAGLELGLAAVLLSLVGVASAVGAVLVLWPWIAAITIAIVLARALTGR